MGISRLTENEGSLVFERCTDNNLDPPTAWLVEFSLTNGEADMNLTTMDGTTSSLLLRGLHPGSEYRVHVAGVNARGPGELSAYAINTSELRMLVYLHTPIHMIPMYVYIC